ncbi:MAG TPA: alpha/beta hydrolase [Xanthobacteraceae bacterium]
MGRNPRPFRTGLRPRRLTVAVAACIAAVVLPQSIGVDRQAAAQERRQVTPAPAPLPRPRPAPEVSSVVKQTRTRLVEFELSPFPYEGINPATGRPFINVDETGRRGHAGARGRVYWEDETYSDQRVLVHIPEGFDLKRPGIIIVFFHGHGAAVDRDVRDRQRIAEQISGSNANAVLIAPQMAVKAADSSAGIFWEQGLFAQFLNEAAEQLGLLSGVPGATRTFDRMPVVLVAYSGGYLATAWSLHHGGANNRVRGVVLLDALYGELDKYERWITTNRNTFFVSAYLGSTRARNLELRRILSERLPVSSALGERLRPGSVTFLAGGADDNHADFANRAWGSNPITDLLNRLPEYRRN